MDDRRKLQRKYLMMYSRVFDCESGRVIGYLSDLSVLGAMIIGETAIKKGLSLQIRIDLPESLLTSKDNLQLNARVAWCKPDIDPSFHNVGFEFIDATQEDLKIIDQMVDAYEFKRDAPNYPPSISSLEEKA
jgi:hypothetical protein